MLEKHVQEQLPQSINLFYPEQRQALEKDGYEVYELTGRTIKEVHDGGYRIFNPLPTPWEIISELSSMRSEVAIHPQLFLPHSSHKMFDEQMEMVITLGKEIDEQIPGVGTMLGSLADYIELASLDSKKRGGGEVYRDLDNLCAPSESIRTKTTVSPALVSPHGVSRLNIGAGLNGNFWASGLSVEVGFPDYERDLHMWIIPLIVPPRRRLERR